MGSENPLGRWVGCRPDRVVENRHWCQEKDGLSERPRKGGGRGHRAGSAGIRDIKYEMMIIPAVWNPFCCFCAGKMRVWMGTESGRRGGGRGCREDLRVRVSAVRGQGEWSYCSMCSSIMGFIFIFIGGGVQILAQNVFWERWASLEEHVSLVPVDKGPFWRASLRSTPFSSGTSTPQAGAGGGAALWPESMGDLRAPWIPRGLTALLAFLPLTHFSWWLQRSFSIAQVRPGELEASCIPKPLSSCSPALPEDVKRPGEEERGGWL